MRIALVSEHASPLAALGGADAGGQNVHVAHLAAGLAARGHDVVVYTRRDDPHLPDRIRTDDGYWVDHVPAGPAAAIAKDDIPPHLDELSDGLAQRWRRHPVDVVHAHFWMSGLAAARALELAASNAPLVQTFHALGVVKRRHQGLADTSPEGRVEAETRLLDWSDHVIATCSDEVAELRCLGMRPERVSVIPCGVSTRRFHPEARGATPAHTAPHRLLCVGRLVPRKGVDTVIRALAALPDTELIVAGGPPAELLGTDAEVRRLRDVAREMEVADRIRFIGGVPSDQVPALITSSDIVVTGAWYEPFGIVPVEAMACGVPVLATDVGGHRDTVVEGVTGERVPPHDPEAMAVALRQLLDDDRRRQRYGAAGRRRTEELYDWDVVVRRTEVVYRTLITARASAAAEVVS